jgi:hypothetical protein
VAVAGDGALHESSWWRLEEPPAGVDAASDAAAPAPASFEWLGASGLAERSPGLVYFEDGSFSDGPLSLAEAAAGASLANPGCIQIEQCVHDGLRRRLRVTHTLALRRAADVAAEQYDVAAEDLDPEEADDLLLQQLRVRAAVENWVGTAPAGAAAAAAAAPGADGDAPPAPPPAPAAADAGPALASQPRAAPGAFCGAWHAFVRAAAPRARDAAAAAALDSDPDAAAAPSFAHEAYEVERVAVVPPGRPYPPEGLEDDDEEEEEEEAGDAHAAAAQHHGTDDNDDVAEGAAAAEAEAEEEEGDVGSALWLPGGVLACVELGTGPARDGLTLRTGWALPREGLVYIEREYDGDGRLVEVRHISAGRPGAGGRGPDGA